MNTFPRTEKFIREELADAFEEAEKLNDLHCAGEASEKDVRRFKVLIGDYDNTDAVQNDGGQIEQFQNELSQLREERVRSNGRAISRLQQFQDGGGDLIAGFVDYKPKDSIMNTAIQQPKAADKRQALLHLGHALIALQSRRAGGNDPRSEEFLKQHGDVLATQTTSPDTAGGFTVPDPLSANIIERREQVSLARKIAEYRTMTSGTLDIPVLESGPTVVYPGEATAIATSDQVWGTLKATAVKRAVLVKYSQELSDDAIINTTMQLTSRIGYELGLQENAEYILGDGSGTYGGEEGLLDQLDATGIVTGSGATFDDLVLADFTSLMGLLPSRYNHTPDATSFICSSEFYYDVMVRVLSAGGGNTVATLEAGAAGRPQFLGKPVYFASQMPTATAISQVSCLYGNFIDASIFADRTGIQMAFSDQRYFEEDVLAVRATSRYDLLVYDGGSGAPGAYVGLATAAS